MRERAWKWAANTVVAAASPYATGASVWISQTSKPSIKRASAVLAFEFVEDLWALVASGELRTVLLQRYHRTCVLLPLLALFIMMLLVVLTSWAWARPVLSGLALAILWTRFCGSILWSVRDRVLQQQLEMRFADDYVLLQTEASLRGEAGHGVNPGSSGGVEPSSTLPDGSAAAPSGPHEGAEVPTDSGLPRVRRDGLRSRTGHIAEAQAAAAGPRPHLAETIEAMVDTPHTPRLGAVASRFMQSPTHSADGSPPDGLENFARLVNIMELLSMVHLLACSTGLILLFSLPATGAFINLVVTLAVNGLASLF